MISRFIYSLTRSADYIKGHPQFAFVLVLILVLPLLFLYSGQQFLDVGRANQDRLQKDRVGLLHDSFVSILSATNFSSTTIQAELSNITALNPDIANFYVAHLVDGELTVVASLESEAVGDHEVYADLFRTAAVRVDESLIFEVQRDTGRTWLTYRALERTPGDFYFLFTEFSLATVDKLFAERERAALFSLVYIYLFLLVLAYWHIRMTDYRYLYTKAQGVIATKDQFMNMMAHELRAPLTAMRGYASMIVESPVSDEVRQQAAHIGSASERLIAIVNDLLDVARLQSGKLVMDSNPFSITAVVVKVADELKVMAESKGITLLADAPPLPLVITGDERRLEQALTNLVSNAIKYTAHGAIELALTSKGSKVEIRVKDTGSGISFDDQQKLFAPFFRVSGEQVASITGSGLGMWITKQLIELMGGTIAVESIKGVGTHVVVVLPIEPGPTRTIQK